MALSSSKVSVFSLSPVVGDVSKKLVSSSSSMSFVPSSSSPCSQRRSLKVSAVDATVSLTGVIFQPFEEVKKEVLAVPIAPNVSLARQRFEDESEAAINEQIK